MLLWLTTAALANAPIGPACAGPTGLAADEWRPELSGPARSIDVDRFRLHWTDEGEDALTNDTDGDGTPDLVELVGSAVAQARQRYDDAGWRPLVADSGAGESDATDIYFVQIDANGYANPTVTADGDETGACYIRLDPDITGLGGDAMAASVAVHELHHCVQFRYTARSASWVYEAQATLEQFRHVVDPVADVVTGVLWHQRLSRPDRPLDHTGGRFEYAGFVWFKFWEEAGGGALPDVWEALSATPDWATALGAEAERTFGMDLGDTFLEHAVWNGFGCARDDGRHYDADRVGCLATSRATVPVRVQGEPGPFRVVLEGAYVADYVEVPHDGSSSQIRATCTVDGQADFGLAVVDVGSGERVTGRVDGGRLVVDGPRSGGQGTLIVTASLHGRGAVAECSVERVALPPLEAPGACGSLSLVATWLWLPALALLRRRRT